MEAFAGGRAWARRALLLGVCAATFAVQAAAAAASPPRLTGTRSCPRVRAVTCATLTVRLDHAGQVGGGLQLRVGIDKVRHAPRGVLLFLTGGPGQPGVRFLPLLRSLLGSAFNGYRLVMLDQRGTGGGALRCPALQRAVGSSDLAVPPRGAVAACARTIGSKRRYFTTPETVADIDALRVALGARRLTLDGISYGTFVAERYALRYPTRVARLVLDSVVPQQGVDPLLLDAYNATPHVLRMACAEEHCGYDPARALHAVVRARHDGPRLLNAIVSESAGRASFTKALSALHAAERGQHNALDALIRQQERASAATASELSQGLHESTVCLDLPPPSNPAASRAQRAGAIARRLALVRPAALYPFDRATARGNGLLVGCLEWPATIPPRLGDGNPAAKLPPVPVLLLAGGHDLSTPVAWARQEAAKAPRGRLVVVAGSGHSVQTGSRAASARRVVQRFLHG